MTKKIERNRADAAAPIKDVDKNIVEAGPRPGMVRNYVAERKLWQIVRLLEHESKRLKANGSDHAQTVEANLRAVEKIIWESPPLEDYRTAEVTAGATTYKWPWGSHETELLRQLADAADHFWKLYDPKDPSTAPENGQVVDWLREQGVAERNAEIMAKILRADGLRPGPRKQ